MISLHNKVTLITGASRGIGRATAEMFAKAGSHIIINYLSDESAAEETKRLVERHDVKALALKADVSDQNAVSEMVDRAVAEFSRIDVLVANAGIWERNPIDSMNEERLRRSVDVNLFGVFFPTMAVVPQMKEQKSGSIILISSTAGQRGEAFHSPYAATKGAVISLTKSLGPELIEHNIRVNCVAPGWVETDMSHEALLGEDRQSILGKIPMNRAADPRELAGPILFLASDLATFITGEILNVNGGAVMCG